MKPLVLIAACLVMVLTACNNSHKYEIQSKDLYEANKAQLAEAEKKNPERFLTAQGGSKKNVLGQTVIRGKLFNNARIVTFKDIDIKLSFYSKTGALLGEDHEIVYETMEPGSGKNFKSKYFAPKGTDSVSMKVISAKY
jgi:hypothetical protein